MILQVAYQAAVAVATTLVLLGTVPVLAGAYQFLLVGLSVFRTHLESTEDNLPRVAVLIPAWNEGSVIAPTIDRLMKLDYPKDRLRIYVVDDASSDETPTLTIDRSKRYRGNVFHIRRVAGGEGKAHTLNYGLDELWKGEWTEAILIMDADVIYTETSLKRMARHLADPTCGAVTAYIKEGSRAPNAIQRFIGFEYITATGASRRAQNVLGFLACLSGGAQLHSRENMLAIGGKIFDDTLAEDTFTTFRTQLRGRMAIFEPNALVYAEEPDDLVGLWKQRVRWARGNVQITSMFRKLWWAPDIHPTMGSLSMAVLWFSIFLMPLFQIGASVGLLSLWVLDDARAWALFEGFWILAGVVYLLVTAISVVIDTESAEKTWLEGILFPGFVSLAVITHSLVPPLTEPIVDFASEILPSFVQTLVILMLYAWQSLAMLVSWSAKELEIRGHIRASRVVLYIAGYGAFLCAVTFGSYIKEWQGAARTWDKTVKTGKVA
jgi:cellulose synthase/poly-beta-1,6-N-acetylglucosamine synthase-like glycosyltransferase